MKIEKRIPVPPAKSKLRYPWPDMVAGDSILLPEATAGLYGQNAICSWRRWASRNQIVNRAVVTRRLGEGKVRVWVVAKQEVRS